MSVVMSFSIYAVRMASDIPVQSECVPKMGLFILLSSIFNFLVMIWFIVLNMFKSKEYLPKLLNLLADCLQKIICLCFQHKKDRQTLVVSSKVKDTSELQLKANSEIEVKCRFCSNKSKNVEMNDKTEMKKILDSQFELLNKLFFILFFLITIILNVSIWCNS
jgi:hypothetical protein